MDTIKISRSKLIKLLIDSKNYDNMSRNDLIEILNDSTEAYYDNLDTSQLEIEGVLVLNKKIEIVDD